MSAGDGTWWGFGRQHPTDSLPPVITNTEAVAAQRYDQELIALATAPYQNTQAKGPTLLAAMGSEATKTCARCGKVNCCGEGEDPDYGL